MILIMLKFMVLLTASLAIFPTSQATLPTYLAVVIDCEITDQERTTGINIKDLIQAEK